ncbi:enterobactin ABC transporter permease [Paraoerskovia sediminicola]|uniref:Enterobactin ABC transporter permease n=1 Tax=Paraoerskovia sediminicola TaxID=1138587 RepID=A0ABM8G733_9CELL|nr:iron chelate uptake ABC transporter family permease subunit [Paraoerskovia sediminicola]BDZ43967.1 enterobactin ABC transporter permease [Paraoerskovia sediminicola]
MPEPLRLSLDDADARSGPVSGPSSGRSTGALRDPGDTRDPRGRRVRLVLLALVVLAVVACAAFLLLDVQGAWSYVLGLRSRTLGALLVVALAIAVSTVVFQTVTENRILTPSIMGFDALYVLVQTVAVFTLGAVGLSGVPAPVQFGVTLVVMLGCSVALFAWIFGAARRSVHLLVLVGVVLGVLLRSLTAMLQRMIDPNEFQVLQARLFASFTGVDPALLGVSGILLVGTCWWLWRRRHELDVLALGRPNAVALGVEHRRRVMTLLVAVSLLVSVSTALVGPITFFGLLVANLAYVLTGSSKHAVTLPTAALTAVVVLVGGQAVLDHVLSMGTVLSVVIELCGGIVFIVLLVASGRRR